MCCGDVDVVFVYVKFVEEEFFCEGYGVWCFLVMYNDFVIIGLKLDLVGIVCGVDVLEVLCKIKFVGVVFVLCGDCSGMYIVEVNFWMMVGIDIVKEKGLWYCEIG